MGPAFRRSPRWDAEVLDVEEQRRGTAPGVGLALTPLDVLATLLAVLASDGEGQRAQPLLGDFVAAFEAVAVVTMLEARNGVLDLGERFRLHLDEGKLQIFLNVRFSALHCVEDFIQLASPGALFANAANLALHL